MGISLGISRRLAYAGRAMMIRRVRDSYDLAQRVGRLCESVLLIWRQFDLQNLFNTFEDTTQVLPDSRR